MSRNRTNQSWKWLPMAAVLALVWAGCAADSSSGGAALGPGEAVVVAVAVAVPVARAAAETRFPTGPRG